MALAHDAQTRWPATNGTVGVDSTDTNTGDQTFTHTPSGTPAGAVVVVEGTVANAAITTNVVTGVLYGGFAMGGPLLAADTSEDAVIAIYWLAGQLVPAGAQTVTLQGCTSSAKWATCSTVTAATSGTVVHKTGVQNTTTTTNSAVSLITTSTSLIYGATVDGAAAPATAMGTGCTLQLSQDWGANVGNTGRRTSPDAAGTIALSFTFSSDDNACGAVALAESPLIFAKTGRGVM